MNEQILDVEEEEQQKSHSKISFRWFLFSIFCLSAMVLNAILRFKLPESIINFSSYWFTCLMIISPFVGLFYAIRSISNKEKNDCQKIIGMTGNSIAVSILLYNLFNLLSG